MALAIIVLLIGIPIGLYMLLRPKQIWWTFSSWKYKNPEANEPSDAAYGFNALGGLGVIVASVILAALAWTRPDPAESATHTTSWTPTPSARYTPPPPPTPPQDRGEIPIVAYHIHDGNLNVSYLVPDESDAHAGGMNTEPRMGCEVMQTVKGLGTDRVTVDLRLFWSDRSRSYDKADDEKCRVTGKWNRYVSTMVVTEIQPGATVLTNGAIIDTTGKLVVPAAPGNAVPNRYCTLDGCR